MNFPARVYESFRVWLVIEAWCRPHCLPHGVCLCALFTPVATFSAHRSTPSYKHHHLPWCLEPEAYVCPRTHDCGQFLSCIPHCVGIDPTECTCAPCSYPSPRFPHADQLHLTSPSSFLGAWTRVFMCGLGSMTVGSPGFAHHTF